MYVGYMAVAVGIGGPIYIALQFNGEISQQLLACCIDEPSACIFMVPGTVDPMED